MCCGRHVVSIDDFQDVPKEDEHALKQALAHQPIAVAICASPSMQFYHRWGLNEACSFGGMQFCHR